MFRCTTCGAFNRVPQHRPEKKAFCGRCGGALDLSGHPQAATDAGLARALAASPIPVLVDFWAPWCAPCAMAAPALEQVGHAFAGELLVLKVDTERCPLSAELHGIRGVPTFAFFSGGMERARQTGMLPRAQFGEWVARHLAAIRTYGEGPATYGHSSATSI
ncbi:MAG TPA: thioredoxin domain-containing protein [Myxococcaceae bacterium]|nr:thioredoxin domain-containing protein [Myxococcaceae bacterium]